jgi:AraC-like DNA-binding protein
VPILPRDVKKAVDLLKGQPARQRSIDKLAAACGVARRTLEKHFRRFAGRTPSQVRREVRLDRVRRELLRAQPDASVTIIAERCGFNHLGRFAAAYRERYGETPSATLQRRRQTFACRAWPLSLLSPALDRPAIAVHGFDLIGTRARSAATIADEISAALLRNRWLAVGSTNNARYHLRGKVRDDGRPVFADHGDAAAAFILAGKKEEARRSFAELIRAYPELTIAEANNPQLCWGLLASGVP